MADVFLDFDVAQFNKGEAGFKAMQELHFRFGDSELIIGGSIQTIEALADELRPGCGGYVSLTIRRPTDAS